MHCGLGIVAREELLDMVRVRTGEPNRYYVDQLCAIGVCTALGGTGIMMYYQKKLAFLVDGFHPWVLAGGIALVLLVLIRAVSLWFSLRPLRSTHARDCPDHEHHGQPHDRERHRHEYAAADDHGHEHGSSPWRYAVLLLPVVLYLFNMPNEGFSKEYLIDIGVVHPDQFGNADVLKMDRKGKDVLRLGFSELSTWAQNQNSRQEYEGYMGTLTGCFAPMGSDKVFTLVRFKRFCCEADMVAVKVLIVCEEGYGNIPNLQCVEVEGQIQFRENPRRKGEFLAVLQVPSRDKITLLPDDPGIKYMQ